MYIRNNQLMGTMNSPRTTKCRMVYKLINYSINSLNNYSGGGGIMLSNILCFMLEVQKGTIQPFNLHLRPIF